MNKTVHVYVALNLVGCIRLEDTGYAKEEWDKLSEEEQQVVVQGSLYNLVDVWTEVE